MHNEFIVDVQATEDGDGFIEIPEQILKELNLGEGDTLSWSRLDDGSGFYLEKE